MSYKERVEKAVDEIKAGRMVIIMDDEDREDEGDLVFAAEHCTAEMVNFMTKYARGLVCVSITDRLARDLALPQMVSENSSNHTTAFTVSIDASSVKTGISAFERAVTIRLLCDEGAKASDFVRPGHIFPLTAKRGGVLERIGHTEASVDLCALAGLKKISVICEILKDDGTMANRGDTYLLDFAREYNLSILYVSDLVRYRLAREMLIRDTKKTNSTLMGISTVEHRFFDALDMMHVAYSFTGVAKVPSVAVFPSLRDIELLGDVARYDAFLEALDTIRMDGGYLLFIHGASKVLSINDIGMSACILRSLGAERICLLDDEALGAGLTSFGIEVVRRAHE